VLAALGAGETGHAGDRQWILDALPDGNPAVSEL
jgi:hypothetical protein